MKHDHDLFTSKLNDAIKIELVVKELGLIAKYGLVEGNGYYLGKCIHGHGSLNGQCFRISSKGNFYNCFHCKRSGNVVSLVMHEKKLDFKQAARWLVEQFAPHLQAELKKNHLEPTEDEKRSYLNAELYQAIVEYGKPLLYQDVGRNALDSLIKRGYQIDNLKQTEWIYWPTALEIRTHLKKHFPNLGSEINQLSLCGDAGDVFRLAFPYRNRWGAITGFVKRSTEIAGEIIKDKPGRRYDSTPGLAKYDLFGLDKIDRERTLVIVEGYPDALYLPTLGLKNVVAVGAGLLSTTHLDGLHAKRIQNIILSYDNDKPDENGECTGWENTSKSIDLLKHSGFNVFVIDPKDLGNCKDPDELVRAGGLDQFKAFIQNPKRADLWKLDYLKGKCDLSSDIGKASFVTAAVRWDAGRQRFDEKFIEAVGGATGFSTNQLILQRKKFEKEGLSKRSGTIDYQQDIADIFAALAKEKADDVTKARVLFTWLKENRKAEYFTDENGYHYIHLDKRLILMSESNSDFCALLLSTANITTADKFGRVIVQVMNASAHLDSKRIKRNTWLETREEDLTVYLNLKNEENEILKITPDVCEVIQNGNNADNVFMLDTAEDKLKPIRFVPMDAAGLKAALDLSMRLVANHLPCADEDRWFTYGWRLSYPLYDFTGMHLTVRAQGPHDQGKSTACKILTCSLYGDVHDNKNTVASLYSDASINPLIVEDNLENKKFYSEPEHGDFYLLAATGGSKQNFDGNSGSGLITERIRALLLCNGIESIAKSEQTSRMMIVECDKDTYNSQFTSAVLLDIKRHRNEILSANFILTQRVLGRIKAGDWQKVQKDLDQKFPKHPKSRMFEHIAIIILYLEEYNKAAGNPKNVWDLVGRWMATQQESAFVEIVQSDPIVQALDILRQSASKQFDYDRTHFGEEAQKLRSQIIKLDVGTLLAEVKHTDCTFEISGLAGELLSSFSKAFQVHLIKAFPISTGRILSQRMNDVAPELIRHGYEWSSEDDAHTKQKKYTFKWDSTPKQPESAGVCGYQVVTPATIPARVLA